MLLTLLCDRCGAPVLLIVLAGIPAIQDLFNPPLVVMPLNNEELRAASSFPGSI